MDSSRIGGRIRNFREIKQLTKEDLLDTVNIPERYCIRVCGFNNSQGCSFLFWDITGLEILTSMRRESML